MLCEFGFIENSKSCPHGETETFSSFIPLRMQQPGIDMNLNSIKSVLQLFQNKNDGHVKQKTQPKTSG